MKTENWDKFSQWVLVGLSSCALIVAFAVLVFAVLHFHAVRL